MQYPAVDPIPIPAPVWLMKLLSDVTLALHFSAVMLLVGSLALVCFHSLVGRSRKSEVQSNTAYVLARRMPVIMTWVINLGVPPLLFAQVLYGRAIYSSSVLIGVLWFSVILLVMLDYWLLYRVVAAMEAKKPAWWIALIALFITLGIGQIYSMNMTLMLRPEVWREMYNARPTGLQGVHGDPTMMSRWLFVMAGGLVFGGLWALLLSNMRHISEGVQKTLRQSGGLTAVIGIVIQGYCAMLVNQGQSDAVRQGLESNSLYHISGLLYSGMASLTLLTAGFQAFKKSGLVFGIASLLTGFVAIAGAVVYRDGIRDLTLFGKGYDVWNRTEYSNWFVVGLFLLLFVLMIAAIVWLLNVMRRATPPAEQVVS